MTFFNRKVGPRGLRPAGRPEVPDHQDDGRRPTWNILDPAGMPAALPGEFAFAASGQCLTSNHGHTAWLGTAAPPQARVFTSRNRGRTWTVASTPMNSGPSAGIIALAFKQPAPRPRGRRRLRPREPLDQQLREDERRRPSLVAPHGRAARNTARARRGSTATPRSRSARPAATYSKNSGRTWTRFDDGSLDTSTARARRPAGPRAPTAASRTSRASGDGDRFDLDQLALVAERATPSSVLGGLAGANPSSTTDQTRTSCARSADETYTVDLRTRSSPEPPPRARPSGSGARPGLPS